MITLRCFLWDTGTAVNSSFPRILSPMTKGRSLVLTNWSLLPKLAMTDPTASNNPSFPISRKRVERRNETIQEPAESN